jgi:hypothetical protein
MFRYYHIIVLPLIFFSCATHPSISPMPLKQGETYWGTTLSTENGLPVIFMRKGLTDNWDLGLRVGLPIYGTGFDISRLLAERDERSDVLNLSYGFNPNHNIDFTYFRIVRKARVDEKNNLSVHRLRYWVLRGMMIVKGISGKRSTRIGILFGGGPPLKWPTDEQRPKSYRFQWEIGYFHDFNSMPIRAVISPLPFNEDHTLWDEQFEDYPHKVSGFPSEYSRLTGLSFRISFPLGKRTANDSPKGEES